MLRHCSSFTGNVVIKLVCFLFFFLVVGILLSLSFFGRRAVASSQCVDGTYDHGELKCCKCGIGKCQ